MSGQTDNRAPSFIGIGAEKSATTWVWSKLDQHPAIEMSQPKELNFFNLEFDRGLAWYGRHFPGSPGCLQGEISPWYMDDDRVADRIADLFPNVKLLVMLRDPFDRAFSHLLHAAQNEYGGIADLTADQLRRLAALSDDYVRRSCYALGLSRFFELFPRERIGIFFHDDVQACPQDLICRIYEFLGVDSGFLPDGLETPLNKSQNYRSETLHRVASTMCETARSFPVTRHLLEWIYRRTTLRERAIEMLMVDSGRPLLTAEDVLSEDQLSRISDDLRCLQHDLRIEVPASWTARRTAVCSAETVAG
ncbi:MAG: sulfotransferase [Planctomycetaceae bacterium]